MQSVSPPKPPGGKPYIASSFRRKSIHSSQEYSSQKFLCEPLAVLIAAAPRWRRSASSASLCRSLDVTGELPEQPTVSAR